MTKQYNIFSTAGMVELTSQLPKQLRQAILEVIEADPTSNYYLTLSKGLYQMQYFLIEQNPYETYTVCHCFSMDTHGGDYAYESMPLSSILTFYKMATELNFI